MVNCLNPFLHLPTHTQSYREKESGKSVEIIFYLRLHRQAGHILTASSSHGGWCKVIQIYLMAKTSTTQGNINMVYRWIYSSWININEMAEWLDINEIVSKKLSCWKEDSMHFVHTNLPQAGFEFGSLDPQAIVLPTEQTLLVLFSLFIWRHDCKDTFTIHRLKLGLFSLHFTLWKIMLD